MEGTSKLVRQLVGGGGGGGSFFTCTTQGDLVAYSLRKCLENTSSEITSETSFEPNMVDNWQNKLT